MTTSCEVPPPPCDSCSEREQCVFIAKACRKFEIYTTRGQIVDKSQVGNARIYEKLFPNETDLKMRRSL